MLRTPYWNLSIINNDDIFSNTLTHFIGLITVSSMNIDWLIFFDNLLFEHYLENYERHQNLFSYNLTYFL